MSDPTRREMDAIEIAEFLDRRRTGTLALAADDDAYAIPVSYDFDQESQRIHLRLGYGPESQKRSFVDETDLASFVVYDDTDEGWKSVVVRGALEPLAETSLDSAVREAVASLDVPYFRVHDRPAADIEFAIVRITPSKMTGVVEAPR